MYMSRISSFGAKPTGISSLGLTQEFVVECAHALWVVHSIKRLVSLMLLKWFLFDSFIYFMYRMFNEFFLIGWLCVWILSLPCHMHT